MKRDVSALQSKTFDVLVVGGGVYGAALVREAAVRGLSAALVEQADFGAGTSSSSLKIIHGGIRYLQQADVLRTLISIRERSVLLKTAPHLVTPMPCLMPTRGWLMKGRPVMIAGLLANDILSFNRNIGLAPSRRIPMGTTLSRKEILSILPALESTAVTGAAKWYDAFVYDSERLPLGMIKAAAQNGAAVANYVRAESFLLDGNRVQGVRATDRLTGESFDIRTSLVINAASAWCGQLQNKLNRPLKTKPLYWALAVNLLVKNWTGGSYPLGLQATDNNRLYFFAPWRDVTIAGTLYRAYTGSPDELKVTDEDIDSLLKSLNSCLPGSALSRDDVVGIHAGLVPCRRQADPTKEPALLRHSRVTDHAKTDGIEGLLSVATIKYTTARGIAEGMMKTVAKKLNKPLNKRSTRNERLPGGDMNDPAGYLRDMARSRPEIPRDTLERMTSLYGTELNDILMTAATLKPDAAEEDNLLRAELLTAIRDEMPHTLGDLLYRRTGLASTGTLSEAMVRRCAAIMAAECGWDAARTGKEIDAVLHAPLIWQAACAEGGGTP